MNFSASRPLQSNLPLAERRTLLLARIQVARGETTEAARLVAADLQKTERSIHNGWRLLKATAFATGIVWSLNAASKMGRGRRFPHPRQAYAELSLWFGRPKERTPGSAATHPA